MKRKNANEEQVSGARRQVNDDSMIERLRDELFDYRVDIRLYKKP
jgi:hypothetical protein